MRTHIYPIALITGLLTTAAAVACSDYNSIEAREAGPALTLDSVQSTKSMRVLVCYDGDSADGLDLEIEGVVGTAGATVEFTIEDGASGSLLDEGKWADSSVTETAPAYLFLDEVGGFEAVCATGLVVTLEQPELIDPLEITWSVYAVASDSYGEEILEDNIAIIFEAI